MPLTSIEESLLVATYFRGGSQDDSHWTANSDQILTLSLFYTGDISFEECSKRFSQRGHVSRVYGGDWELTDEIEARYRILIDLLQKNPELIEGAGFRRPADSPYSPADPPYSSCRLTDAGKALACMLIQSFPRKPEFPNWPDKRTYPGAM